MLFEQLSIQERNRYERMWTVDKDSWFLLGNDNGKKLPINKKTRAARVIEDDDVAVYVVKMMERNGVELLQKLPWQIK